ncbi:uncharacterized protein Aud_003913 [Aspergillus udagawae]|uniref:Transcription factor domain-containing protein n=1 Tax=Aspergillus udagawae TaxID=91492 RepID=A0A8E0QQE5_9EURO|nr:uncharacterized protein Aud_003913 [Aspergillus udagawae]GIC87529.1 hypothetical protein Aud_003913 [Aspergillus udagawae]
MGPINTFPAPSATNGAADWRESFESALQTLASPFAHQYTNSKETVGAWGGSNTLNAFLAPVSQILEDDRPQIPHGLLPRIRSMQFAAKGRHPESQAVVNSLHDVQDIVDMPLAQCMSRECMPPCYSLGITALGPLGESAYTSPYLDPVRSRIDRFWNISVTSSGSEHAAPQIFLAASLLGALFQLSMPTYSSRHESINEAYKWVAIAAASQFTVREDNPPCMGRSHGRARDIALATWQKAKQIVFENIAATRSFRLALCLLLFGTLFPPMMPEGSSVLEDAAYTTREGLQRLQMLCAEARAHCVHDPDMSRHPSYRTSRVEAARKSHPVQMLPTDVREYILELIAAVEWLASMFHSAAVVCSRRDTCTTPCFVYCNRSSYWTIDITREQGATRQHKQGFEDYIIARAQADTHRVTALWSRPMSDDIVARAVSQAGSVAILIWQTLAILILTFEQLRTDKVQYEELHRCYSAMTNLIDVWRSAWGQIDRSAAISLHRSRPNVLRGVYFCYTDVDFAILLFCELICQLGSQLAEQISSSSTSSPARERLWNALKEKSACHRDQRRTSAMQISHLAMASQGMSSPGFQGKSGLKANVEDISAHPYPTLVVQAHKLAAKALADEIQCSISKMDAKRIQS